MSDDLARMNITAWTPRIRSLVRACLLNARAASHAESVEIVRIVRLIDEVNEREHEDEEVARQIDEASEHGTFGGSL